MTARRRAAFFLFLILAVTLRLTECAVSFTRPTKVPPAYEDVNVQEGSDAKLLWTYSVTNRTELDTNQAVRWNTFIPQLSTPSIVNRRGIINEKRDGTRQNLGTTPSYLTGRVSIENPATLVIDNVKTTDDNFYECYLATTSLVTPFVRSLIKLTVIKPPVITPPSMKSSYNEGTKVDITCNVTGKPTPTVTWFRVGSSKVQSTGEGSAALSFSSVSKSDAGQYKCKANNTAGTKETEELPLVVHYKPSITKPTESPHPQTVWVAVNNELKCTADGNPQPMITWTKNRAPFTENVKLDGNTSTLTLASVSVATEADQYVCTATNNQGKASATFDLALGPPGTEPTTAAPTDPNANAGARGSDDGTGVLIGAIVGAVVGVILIVILIVYFVKCRKGNRGNRAPQGVGLTERGTKSVSDIDDYEPVARQNELPQYASVDRSKKYQRKPELNYAELDHRGAERSVDQRPTNRRSEPTTYADIVQTWEPTNESAYANVPKGGHYSNDML